MKLRFIIPVLLWSAAATAQGISFIDDKTWPEIKKLAKNENKFIFIDAFTTWCVPCKQMSEQTFSDGRVGEFINKRYISVQVQMDKTEKDSERIKQWYDVASDLGKAYRIDAYPSLLFISPSGNLVHKAVGFLKSDEFIIEAEKAIALSENYDSLLVKFQENKLDTAEIRKLAEKAKQLKDDKNAFRLSEAYLNRINKSDIYKKNNLAFIASFLTRKSKYFPLFFNNRDKINTAYGESNFVENKIMAVVYKEMIAPHESKEVMNWDEIEKNAFQYFGELGRERVWGHRMLYHYDHSDWPNFGKYYKLYFEKAMPLNRSFIHMNNMSWIVFENIADTSVINCALTVMKKIVDEHERYDAASIDTYANLLYKANRKEEAITWEQLAVRLSEKSPEYVATLEKMKKDERTW